MWKAACCILTLVFLLSAACTTRSPKAGFTENPSTRSEKVGLSEVFFNIQLTTPDGAPLSGVLVTASTPEFTDQGVSNSEGRLQILCKAGDHDALEFVFKERNGKSRTELIYDFPRGKAQVGMIITQDKRGFYRVLRYEF